MKPRTRVLAIVLMLISVVACTGFKSQSRHADIRRTVAAAYGVQYFEKVEQIRYTFNVQIGDRRISRSWIWQPQSDQVTFTSGSTSEPTQYSRKELKKAAAGDRLEKIDKWFINDNYWLIFPLRVAWDHTVQVEDSGRKALPMGTGSAQCMKVTFPDKGGYTPGDVYELYLDDAFRVTHWVYRRAGAAEPTRITTWEDHRSIGPLIIALDHRGSDQNFRVWFTDVAIKTAETNRWMYPQ